MPLSVAPDAASQESKCAESTTYSSGNSVPGSRAMTLDTGVERNRDSMVHELSSKTIQKWSRISKLWSIRITEQDGL